MYQDQENKAVRILGGRNHFRMRLLGNPIREKTDFEWAKNGKGSEKKMEEKKIYQLKNSKRKVTDMRLFEV